MACLGKVRITKSEFSATKSGPIEKGSSETGVKSAVAIELEESSVANVNYEIDVVNAKIWLLEFKARNLDVKVKMIVFLFVALLTLQ